MKRYLFVSKLAICFFFYFFQTDTPLAQNTKAEKLAREIANRITAEVHPKSVVNLQTNVYDWEYNPQKNKYIIKMSISWRARSCLFCLEESTFEIVGFLEVNSNGSHPKFIKYKLNEALEKALNNSDLNTAFF